jgi:hypothetical protein
MTIAPHQTFHSLRIGIPFFKTVVLLLNIKRDSFIANKKLL